MGTEILGLPYLNGIKPYNAAYPKSVYPVYGKNLSEDTFEKKGVEKYTAKAFIEKSIALNPVIKDIIGDVNPDMLLNMKELNELSNSHSLITRETAAGIANHLPLALKLKVKPKALADAAYLHDIGKVLIPTQILNKSGKLNETEEEIMHRHSNLSYELLKSSDLDPYTLNLILYHHQNSQKTGYPYLQKGFKADINLQILSCADKYSALTEKRPYKEQMSPAQALTIIYKDVKKGTLSPFVFTALAAYARENAVKSLQY